MFKKTVETVFKPLVVNVFITKHFRYSRLTGWCGKHDLRQKRSKSKFSFSPYWGFVSEALHPIFGPQVISSVWGNKCPLEMICKYPLRCCKNTIKTTITITQGLPWMEIISKYPSRSCKHRLCHVPWSQAFCQLFSTPTDVTHYCKNDLQISFHLLQTCKRGARDVWTSHCQRYNGQLDILGRQQHIRYVITCCCLHRQSLAHEK